MAKIYANAIGEIVKYLKTEDDEATIGIPDVFASMLEFDLEVNSSVGGNLDSDWNNHSMFGDILTHNGQPVTVNPPGEYYQDHEYLRTWWQQLNTALDNTNAALFQTEQAESLWPTLTAKQKQDWLVAHFDEVLGGLALVLRVLHGVLRFIRWLIKREAIV